jgi:hypothetical protein
MHAPIHRLVDALDITHHHVPSCAAIAFFPYEWPILRNPRTLDLTWFSPLFQPAGSELTSSSVYSIATSSSPPESWTVQTICECAVAGRH